MAANALVQTWIDAEVRDRASAVLESMGLTVSDADRILLARTANERALPLELLSGSETHGAWFRTKVLEALNDTRPDLSDEEVEAHFSERRATARLTLVCPNRDTYLVCICVIRSRRHLHIN